MMDYQVKINNFEGPMDLLLFFIQRDRLNIYDKLKELSDISGDHQNPELFDQDHAFE